MKKTVTVLSALLILLSCLNANSEDTGREDWNLHFGTGIYVSQIGFSRNFGEMEVGANLDTGFPNLFIISMIDGASENGGLTGQDIWTSLTGSLSIAYAGDVYFKYDVIKSGKFDFDLSVGLAGIYSTLSFLRIAGGFVEAGFRLGYNFNSRNGIYLETNVPAYAFTASQAKNDEEWSYQSGFLTEEPATMLLISGLFCTRIGYRHSF